MSMYGQSFTLASAAKNGLNSRTYGGGTAGPFTRARGFLAYYEICDKIQNKGWKVIQDPTGNLAYIRVADLGTKLLKVKVGISKCFSSQTAFKKKFNE